MESNDLRLRSKRARDRFRRRRLRYLGAELFDVQAAPPPTIAPELYQAVESKVLQLGQENEQLRDAVTRQKAEFDNFRRRTLKEKEQVREATREDLISRLLPVLDNFERAIQAASQTPEAASIRQGVEMIATQLAGALEADGLKRIDALSAEFDPNLHDAIAVEERTDVAENTVVEVMLPGYRLGERVIRPAMVKVAKAPES